MRAMLAAVAAVVLWIPGAAQAAAVNKVFYPAVEWGEKEIELRGFFTQDADPAKDNFQVNKFDVAYGATQWWFTELEFVYVKPPGGGNELEAIASENVFQLTNPGEYWADVGLFAEYEHVMDTNISELVLGPIVQKQFGSWLTTANFFFEKEVGSESTEGGLELNSALQVKYLLTPAFEPGVEYYGYEEDQNAGPAAFGMVKLGQTKLKWQVAWLFGLTDTAADNSIRWMFEYEF